MPKKKYPHFNPKDHKIESKIATVKKGHHYKYNINYHIVWIPKHRKPILKRDVKLILKKIIEGVCYDNRWEMLALEIMLDYLHLFIGTRPTDQPSNIVKELKGNTSRQLRLVYPFLKYLGYKKWIKRFPNLWARGYYCGSAGHVSQEQVRRYILEQEGKDIFEYSIFGVDNSQTKIGGFTR